MSNPGYVYFIRCGQYVKIGWSFLPEARKRELETGNPHDCVLEGMHVGTQLDERRMHRYFRSLHHRGEWFRWCIDIENVAKNRLPQLIHGRRVDLRLGADARKTARGPFEIRRSMEN